MRKGQYLESQINKVIKYVNEIGGHAHKNNPSRTVDGIYLSGEPFDYEIFLKNYKACFDAKEVKGDVWHLKDKDVKQAENLKHCKNIGLNAYFLILFNQKELLEVDVDDVIEELKKGKKSIHKEKGTKSKLNEILNKEYRRD